MIMHDMVEWITRPIIRRKFWHKESPWGVVMDDMRAKRRGEHVIQPFADKAKGWFI